MCCRLRQILFRITGDETDLMLNKELVIVL